MPEDVRDLGGLGDLGDLDLETFRTEGRRLVDWIARYLEGAERLPVVPRVRPGEIRAALPATPPPRPEPLETILADVERQIVPGLTHWNHPGFFAYFANSSTAPAILGEMLSAAFNANAMLWKTAPAATELEVVVMDWLRQMTGLPEGFFGVIQDTASAATLVGLAAAREAVPGLEARRRGLVGQARLRMYASEEAHSSVERRASHSALCRRWRHSASCCRASLRSWLVALRWSSRRFSSPMARRRSW